MKRIRISTLIVAAGLMVGGFIGVSESEAQVHQGLQEISFSGSYDHGVRDNDQRRLNVRGDYGYFFTNELALVFSGDVTRQRDADGDSTTGGRLGGGADWHFPLEGMHNFVPYVGGRYLFAVGSGEDEDHVVAHAGVKHFITRSVAVNYNVGYGFDPSNTSDASVRGNVGLSFFF